MKHYDLKISGHVQGVNFRSEAKRLADVLGIFGLARNQADGTIYIEAEGNEDPLQQFLAWCEKGPQYADVDNLEVVESDVKGYDKFTV